MAKVLVIMEKSFGMMKPVVVFDLPQRDLDGKIDFLPACEKAGQYLYGDYKPQSAIGIALQIAADTLANGNCFFALNDYTHLIVVYKI